MLPAVAAVASDLILDTGELVSEFGHVGGVHMAQHILPEELPRGKKAVALWIEGFSTIFSVIYKMFTEPVLLEALEKLPKSDRILVTGYTKHTEIEHALSGLVQQAQQEWADDFQEAHCDKKWDKLPACAKHDFDWSAIEDMPLIYISDLANLVLLYLRFSNARHISLAVCFSLSFSIDMDYHSRTSYILNKLNKIYPSDPSNAFTFSATLPKIRVKK